MSAYMSDGYSAVRSISFARGATLSLATRRIKSAPETRHIPVIALTANAMTGDKEKALAAGCDDFDTKPVELARLLDKIQALAPGGAAS